jgi:2-keto-4-pentenoate hydratase
LRSLALSFVLLLAIPAAAAADCPGQADNVETVVEAFLENEAVESLDEIPSYAAARCIADRFVALIGPEGAWGPVVGYKLGLTSKGMRERLKIAEPIWGQLTQAMLLENQALVPLGWAARPIAEADLMVTIADAGIMDATTPDEAARHVSQITGFIELANLVFADGVKLTRERFVAVNAGARLGVVGTSLPMTPELAAALPHLTVNMTTLGKKRWDSEGSRLMGHPLQPLVWLVAQLKAEGRSLQAGDVVALGSFGPPLTPEMPGQDMLVTYTDESGADLPGGPLSVRVKFTAP